MSVIDKLYVTCKTCGNQFFITPKAIEPDVSTRQFPNQVMNKIIECPNCASAIMFDIDFTRAWNGFNKFIEDLESTEKWQISTESPYKPD